MTQLPKLCIHHVYAYVTPANKHIHVLYNIIYDIVCTHGKAIIGMALKINNYTCTCI